MLTARPRSLFTWDYDLLDGDLPVAATSLATWPERGSVTAGGTDHSVRREGLLSGAFLLEAGGRVVARAVKPSAFARRFEIEGEGVACVLEVAGWFGRSMRVRRGGETVGAIRPRGFLTWRMDVDLPEAFPLPARAFVFWLATLLWRRDAESDAASPH